MKQTLPQFSAGIPEIFDVILSQKQRDHSTVNDDESKIHWHFL